MEYYNALLQMAVKQFQYIKMVIFYQVKNEDR